MKISQEKLIEVIFLIIFTVAFFIPISNLWDQRITHEFPYAYAAADAFTHAHNLEGIKDQGHYRTNFYYESGGFNDVIGVNPPFAGHIGAILSTASGIETYDIMYFLVFLSLYLSCLGVYLLARRYSFVYALLSLPFSTAIFAKGFDIAVIYGQWHYIIAMPFLIGFILIVDLANKGFRNIWPLAGIMISAAFLSHIVEAIWGGFFIIFMYIVFFMFCKFNISSFFNKIRIKEIIFGGLFSIASSYYYIPIFILAWLPKRAGKYIIPGYPTIELISAFGLYFFVFLILSTLLFIFLVKKENNSLVLFSFPLFFILAMHLTFLPGFDKSFQLRFLAPMLLCIPLGAALSFALSFFTKNIKASLKRWIWLFSSIVILVLVFSLFNIGSFGAGLGQGLMDKPHWEAITWVAENTEQSAEIFIGYGDSYSQASLLFNLKRFHYRINPANYLGLIQNRTIKRYINGEINRGDATGLKYRTSFFNFGDYRDDKGRDYFYMDIDLCSVDYYLMDKVTREPVIGQYNMLILQELSQSGWMSKVFENEAVIIVKNNKKGEVCLDYTEKQF